MLEEHYEAAAITRRWSVHLPSGSFRPCDRDAREFVGWPRSLAIGGVPCRAAMAVSSNEELRRLEPWMTRHDVRRMRWLREAEPTAAVPRPELLLGKPGRVLHPDERRGALANVAVPRGWPHRAARADPPAAPRRRRVVTVCRPTAPGSSMCSRPGPCCSPPAEQVGRSVACLSTRRGTTKECVWRSSAEIADACSEIERVRMTSGAATMADLRGE